MCRMDLLGNQHLHCLLIFPAAFCREFRSMSNSSLKHNTYREPASLEGALDGLVEESGGWLDRVPEFSNKDNLLKILFRDVFNDGNELGVQKWIFSVIRYCDDGEFHVRIRYKKVVWLVLPCLFKAVARVAFPALTFVSQKADLANRRSRLGELASQRRHGAGEPTRQWPRAARESSMVPPAATPGAFA